MVCCFLSLFLVRVPFLNLSSTLLILGGASFFCGHPVFGGLERDVKKNNPGSQNLTNLKVKRKQGEPARSREVRFSWSPVSISFSFLG